MTGRALWHVLMRLTLAVGLAAVLSHPLRLGASNPPGPTWAESRSARFLALRLKPGQDLLGELERFAKDHDLHAAFVASCAGSLTHASIRHANEPAAALWAGHFEIVSLSGTLSATGSHLHIAIADSTGDAFGGHLMPGSTIYTTAEIVLGELPGVEFAREIDPTFGYHELAPRKR